MCATCGCAEDAGPRLVDVNPRPARTVRIEERVLARNDRMAARNRDRLADLGVVAVNLMSSPGSGKTTLLERTARELGTELTVSVVEGDQETRADAERLARTGCPVVQINTGTGCHLDARMLAGGLDALDPPPRSLVFVENVGNLVCPALFDLGEDARVVVMSVTEGVDKPVKYPHMFRTADLVVLNKVDLLPHVEFDLDGWLGGLRQVAPHTEVVRVSASRGDGVDGWYGWLRRRMTRHSGQEAG